MKVETKEETTGKLVTVKQAGDYLGVSKWLIYDLCKNGDLKPVVKIGSCKIRGHRFLKNDLDNLKLEKL